MRAMAAKASAASATQSAVEELRAFGLAYPGSHFKSPWPGHKDLAVNDKTFAYLCADGEPFSISCKLPSSSGVALMLPYCKPTGYGLGKSGWVTATPPAGTSLPVDMFKQWIDESYRAQAPKSLVKQLATTPPTTATRASSTKPSSAKPSSAKPSSAKPSSAKPSSAKPSSAKPSSAKPSSAKARR